MRIGFDAAPLIRPTSGVGWHTYHLLKKLLDLKTSVDFVGYIPPGVIPNKELASWAQAGQIRWVNSGKIRQWCMGRADGLDLYHGPNFKMPIQGRSGGVVTIHDLWLDRFPEYSKKLLGQGLSFLRTKRTAWRARCVIAVSHHAANDIQEFYGLPEERVVVISNGVSEDFYPEGDFNPSHLAKEHLQFPTPNYILFVGGASPRKNNVALLRAYAQCSSIRDTHCLVGVGNQRERNVDLNQVAQRLGITNRLVCTGPVSVSRLRQLYSAADIFVFPSLYEGFGMPVLEAMACGAPVITSNASALPEVVGEAAILVNPIDWEELAQAIEQLLNDSVLRQLLRAKGFQRSKHFTWAEAANRTVALYRTLC